MPPKVNLDICNGFAACFDVCPSDPVVFKIVNGKCFVAFPEACLECGACESVCPTGAITLE